MPLYPVHITDSFGSRWSRSYIIHHPYRAALGTDKALKQIKNQRGTLYYSKVDDMCLRLSIETRFNFDPVRRLTS